MSEIEKDVLCDCFKCYVCESVEKCGTELKEEYEKRYGSWEGQQDLDIIERVLGKCDKRFSV